MSAIRWKSRGGGAAGGAAEGDEESDDMSRFEITPGPSGSVYFADPDAGQKQPAEEQAHDGHD
jgi:hypothetical protein